MDMEEESGLDVWNIGGNGAASAFDAPLTADVVSASFSKKKPDAAAAASVVASGVLEMPQQSAQGMRTARAYPVGLLPAAAAPKYDARFDAQGNGMVHMAAAGNAPRDRMHMMATMAQKQQQQQRGAMFHSSVMM
uniref:Uncharacterized protein n=1 Tax=Pseudictyota dubia TaxID=2749911 RepID=A0A7R9Z674_9STRA